MSHNIMRFSTKDKDHNTNILAHCAQEAQGGWWLTACFSSFLNVLTYLGITHIIRLVLIGLHGMDTLSSSQK